MTTMPGTSTIRPADIGLLAGRLLLALIFVHEGATLALHFGDTVRAMALLGIGLPLTIATVALQLGAGLAVALGLSTRLGAGALGSHCNVDPVSKLGNLEHLKASFERFKDTLESKIIIFPQHGLLASDSVGLMREALKSGGVSYVGGVDPTSFDHAMEKSVDTTVQLATDFNVGIDIHIHERRDTAIPAFNRIMDHMEKDKQLQGNVTFSHAYSLAELSKEELTDIAARMKALGVTLASAVPLGKGAMPLRELHEAGIKVICGTDSVMDWWDSFGNCDILQKANEVARLQYRSTEYDISRALGFATGFVTPLNDKGEQVWPKAGDEASFNLVPASCSAEAVARLPVRGAVFHKGKLAYGAVPKAA